MKIILKNTDIFDEKLFEKVTDELQGLDHWYDSKLSYKLSVVYSSRLNYDERMKGFYKKLPTKKNQTKKEIAFQDMVNDVLSFQLQAVIDAFRNYSGIEFATAAIIGRVLENDLNVIVSVDTQPLRSNKRTMTVHSIMPDEAGTVEKATEFLNEYYNRKFNEILEIIDKDFLAEILEVEDSEDMNLLFNVFIREYGDLFATDNEREQQAEKFKSKAMGIAAKHGML